MAKISANQLTAGLKKAAGTQTRDRLSQAAIAAADDAVPSLEAGARSGAVAPAATSLPVQERPQAAVSTSAHAILQEGETPEIGRTYRVPLGMIQESAFNPRMFYTQAALAELAESIKALGQVQAAQGFTPKGHPGKIMLQEGHTRRNALELLGLPHLIVEIVPEPASLLDGYKLARAANKNRNTITILDDAFKFKELLDKGEAASQMALSIAINEPREYINRALSLSSLPVSILKAMAESDGANFGLHAALRIRKFFELTNEAEALALVEAINEGAAKGEGALSVRSLDQIVWDKQNEINQRNEPLHDEPIRVEPPLKEKVKRRTPLTKAIVTAGGNGNLKYFSDGAMELKLTITDEAQRQVFFASVVHALREAGVEISTGMVDTTGATGE